MDQCNPLVIKVKRLVTLLKTLRNNHKVIIHNLDKQIDYLEKSLDDTRSVAALVSDLKRANLQIKGENHEDNA